MAPKAAKLKKPKNAYWLWVEDHKEELFKACGTNSLMQVGEEAGKRWKALGAAGQAPYKTKNSKLEAQYDKDVEGSISSAAKPKRKREQKDAADPEDAEEEEEGSASKKTKLFMKKGKALPGKINKMQYLMMIEATVHGGMQNLLEKYDKDHNGTLDHAEFKDLIRNGLEIKEAIIPDSLIKDLIEALDDDNSGTLDAAEIQDFIDRGEDTFFAGPLEGHADLSKLEEEKEEKSPAKKTKQPTRKPKALPGKLNKMQYLMMIEANVHGGVQNLLEKYDKDHNGTLDHSEFKDLIRNGLKITEAIIPDSLIKDCIEALDDDKSGFLDAAEIKDFIDNGKGT